MIILEEAAYVDPGFFYETVAPLLCMQQTCMLAISTLRDSFNFYTRLVKMRNKTTGDPLFSVVQVRRVIRARCRLLGLYGRSAGYSGYTGVLQVQLACDACIEKGAAAECVHRLHLVPRWQSSDRHEMLKTVMQVQHFFIQTARTGSTAAAGPPGPHRVRARRPCLRRVAVRV